MLNVYSCTRLLDWLVWPLQRSSFWWFVSAHGIPSLHFLKLICNLSNTDIVLENLPPSGTRKKPVFDRLHRLVIRSTFACYLKNISYVEWWLSYGMRGYRKCKSGLNKSCKIFSSADENVFVRWTTVTSESTPIIHAYDKIEQSLLRSCHVHIPSGCLLFWATISCRYFTPFTTLEKNCLLEYAIVEVSVALVFSSKKVWRRTPIHACK